MAFYFLVYLTLILPIKLFFLLIILIVLYVKNKRKSNIILLKITAFVLLLIIAAGGGFVAYMRTVRRWLPEYYEVYAPAGIANKHIYKSAWDGRNETWLYKLGKNENEEALLNVTENDAWNKLTQEDYESICLSCYAEYCCDSLITEKSASFDIQSAYFAIYDCFIGRYLESDEFLQTISYKAYGNEEPLYDLGNNSLILIYDSSSGYYYALRTSG